MSEEKRMEDLARVKDSYVRLFDSDLGREVLEHMVGQVHIGRTPFVPGDPYATAFNAGKAKTILAILDLVDGVDIRTIITMNKTMNQRRSMSYE